ncbi:hypothetical protein HPB50_020653 [Hyalomma asiaticum]|uniref:Uncharacterized protein n=1 Tax=Hyalomma asiaticum TaxID=266040 RepID=A0ACB7RK52_HYAAI|nr:hypothetical protein HPB50_020653 [Hyalomma asiaticum]
MKALDEQVGGRCMAKFSAGRVSRREHDLNHEEMHVLLGKLQELVPNMPRDRKLSKLEIIQNVIDYILDLEIALERHPANFSSRASPAGPARQPLGALPPSANSALNKGSPKEVGLLSKCTGRNQQSPVKLGSTSGPGDA